MKILNLQCFIVNHVNVFAFSVFGKMMLSTDLSVFCLYLMNDQHRQVQWQNVLRDLIMDRISSHRGLFDH
jgi:hypothetical protein